MYIYIYRFTYIHTYMHTYQGLFPLKPTMFYSGQLFLGHLHENVLQFLVLLKYVAIVLII